MGTIKRLFAGVILALLVFPVLTCIPGPPENEGIGDGIVWTDVVYSPDGKSLTLYLEGGVAVPNVQMRGLSKELAMAGHDFFEVVFYHPSKTVRASWELMKEARITGVYGKGGEVPGGVNYSFTTVGLSGAGDGAAILFVGKKVDRTLLAVGKLAQVNGDDGYTIDAGTKTVTFEVAALKSGVGVADAGFFTDYSYSGTRNPTTGNVKDFVDNIDNPTDTTNTTNRTTFPINGKSFPMYKLLQGSTLTHAHYHFALDGGANINNFGIILAGNGEYGKKQPRYPTEDGKFQFASLRLDDKTIITAKNNIYDPGNILKAFQSPVDVHFDTTNVTAQGSAFAFVFEIPVYALTSAVNPAGSTAPQTWYIRGSYDSYWLDLDAGSGSAGGAVLLGIGNPEAPSDLQIRVIVPPLKWRYNGSTSSADNINWGRDLFVDGLVVWLEEKSTNKPNRRLDEHTELTYEIGMKRIKPNSVAGSRTPSANAGELIRNTLYGLQTVTVKYLEPSSGSTYTTSFYIICDDDVNTSLYTNITSSSYFAAANETAFGGVFNTAAHHAGTFIIVLTGSFNVGDVIVYDSEGNNPNPNRPPLFIIVSGASSSGIRIGRASNDTGIKNYSSDTSFYFGKWPFYASLTVSGTNYHHTEYYRDLSNIILATNPYATYGYTLNADGPYTTAVIDPPSAPANGFASKFLKHDRDGSRLYNVTVDGANIVPIGTTQLY